MNICKSRGTSMSMTMEKVVTQLQQEVFALRAQVAAESGLAEAARAINNLTTAQVRKETPSVIDVIKESEMMLEWAAEQTIDITMTSINLEFLPSDTNLDRGVQNLEFVLQQMHTALMALTSYEPNDIVANSRKNPLEAWRRLQQRYDPTTGGRKRNLLRTIISLGRCSSGTPKWHRTLGVLRVSPREEAEG